MLGEINPATDTVMNFFWLGGSFTFAVLLGVVTDDIVVFVEVSQSACLMSRHVWSCIAVCNPVLWCYREQYITKMPTHAPGQS